MLDVAAVSTMACPNGTSFGTNETNGWFLLPGIIRLLSSRAEFELDGTRRLIPGRMPRDPFLIETASHTQEDRECPGLL